MHIRQMYIYFLATDIHMFAKVLGRLIDGTISSVERAVHDNPV